MRRAPNCWWAPKNPNNVASSIFITVRLLPGSAKPVSYPGCESNLGTTCPDRRFLGEGSSSDENTENPWKCPAENKNLTKNLKLIFQTNRRARINCFQ